LLSLAQIRAAKKESQEEKTKKRIQASAEEAFGQGPEGCRKRKNGSRKRREASKKNLNDACSFFKINSEI